MQFRKKNKPQTLRLKVIYFSAKGQLEVSIKSDALMLDVVNVNLNSGHGTFSQPTSSAPTVIFPSNLQSPSDDAVRYASSSDTDTRFVKISRSVAFVVAPPNACIARLQHLISISDQSGPSVRTQNNFNMKVQNDSGIRQK